MTSRNIAGNRLDRARLSKAGGAGSGGGAVADVNGYVRPSDWPAFPADVAQRVYLFAGVQNVGTNLFALTVTTSAGTYDVDWGDGSSDIGVTSGTPAYHSYTYADGDLPAATSEGIKVATVVVKPNTGGANITGFDMSTIHNQAGLATSYSPMWLEARLNIPNLTSGLVFRATGRSNVYMRKIEFVAIGAITSMVSMFDSMTSLESVIFPAGSLASVTTLATAFRDCNRLRSVIFPAGSLASVTSMTTIFSNCLSLRNVSFPAGALAVCTVATNAFFGCETLPEVVFPSGAFNGATFTTSGMFSTSPALRRVVFPPGGMTNTSSTLNMFTGCTNLAKIENCDINITFTIPGAALDAAALDEIYTALPTVTSQTITVTGNYGTAGDNPTIATGKGWTVTS